MSYVTLRYLYCDGKTEDCPYFGEAPLMIAPQPNEPIVMQRSRARDKGWVVNRHGKDYCFVCAEKLGLISPNAPPQRPTKQGEKS